MKNPPLLAIVVPCYCEEAVVEETARRLTAVVDRLVASGDADARSHILFVNDGSTDRTWALIEQLHRQNRRVDGLNLAANVGHQAALLAGLDVAAGRSDAVVSIDADLQDDPDVIPQMVAAYRAGADVVFGVRRSRATDSRFKRVTALAFYRLMNALGTPTVYNHADFRLLSRRAVQALVSFPERNLFLRGLVPLVGYPSAMVWYDRHERFAGQSKYPLKKMLSFAIDGITSFSTRPLRYITYLGLLFVLISIATITYALFSYMNHDVMPGWTSLLVSVWFVGGSVLLACGIIGEYVGKMYKEVKRRPHYFVEKEVGERCSNTRMNSSSLTGDNASNLPSE